MDKREQARHPISLNSVHTFKRRQLVAIPIAFEEGTLRAATKRNHAMWRVSRKVWVMPYSTAVALGLQNRVIEGLAQTRTDVELFVD